MQGLCSKIDDVRSYGQLVGAGTSISRPLEPDLSVLSAPGRKRSPKTCSYESARKTKSKSITDAYADATDLGRHSHVAGHPISCAKSL